MGQSIGRAPARAAINAGDINDGIITSAHIAVDTVVATDIAPNAVTASELADDAVDSDAILDDAVTMAKLSATGTASADTFLRGDNSWAAAGSPSITDNGDANAMTIGSDESVTFVGSTILSSVKQQADAQNLSGTYTAHELITGKTFTVNGNLTVTENLILGGFKGSGTDVTIQAEQSTHRTITGEGTLEGGSLTGKASPQRTSLTGMTGNLGTGITGSPAIHLENAIYPSGHVINGSSIRHGRRIGVSSTGVQSQRWGSFVKKRGDTQVLFQGLLMGRNTGDSDASGLFLGFQLHNNLQNQSRGLFYKRNVSRMDEDTQEGERCIWVTGMCDEFEMPYPGSWAVTWGSTNTGSHLFDIWNPNATDDARFGAQRVSVLLLWEVMP